MKKLMATMMLLAGGLFAAPQIRFGVEFGAPAPAAMVRPACPGPGYTWVDGYYEPDGDFVPGYWAPPEMSVAPAYGYYGGPVFRDRDDFDHDRFDRGHFDRSRFDRGNFDRNRFDRGNFNRNRR